MIAVVGSVNIDLVADVVRLPLPGETVVAAGFATTPGGKGANQALAARRAGADVRLAGAVGTDAFAAEATALLDAAGVDLSGLMRADGPTGTAVILCGAEGENVIAVVPGANGTVDAAQADAALADLAPGSILMAQLELPAAAVAAALRACRARGGLSLLNIAPFTEPESVRELAALADVVIGNETECAALFGTAADDTAAQMEALRAYGAATGRRVVLTLGAGGVACCENGALHHAPALPIRPVDTVGAGDTFCGYLAAALAEGQSLPQAMRLGAVAGSLACLRVGAQAAIPLRAEVDQAMTAE